jgi:hypothetical protein
MRIDRADKKRVDCSGEAQVVVMRREKTPASDKTAVTLARSRLFPVS